MNPNFRLAALIAASLGLVVSLFIALSPGEDEAASTTSPTTTATTAPAETEPANTEPAGTAPVDTQPQPTLPAAPGPGETITIRVAVGPDGPSEVRRFSVSRGRKVELVVRSELTDHVHLHGYDLMADVAPGAPATISFTADAPGRFEIELEDRGLEIAELEVRP